MVRPHHLLANRFRSVHTTSLLAVGGSLGFHAFLPVYLRGVRGMSATAAAFSVVYLSVGWTSGAIISTRLQDHLVREKVVLIGSYFLASGLPLTAVMVFTKAPMPGLIASLVITGLGVGSMSTTGINVLQERALVTEMGRLARPTNSCERCRSPTASGWLAPSYSRPSTGEPATSKLCRTPWW